MAAREPVLMQKTIDILWEAHIDPKTLSELHPQMTIAELVDQMIETRTRIQHEIQGFEQAHFQRDEKLLVHTGGDRLLTEGDLHFLASVKNQFGRFPLQSKTGYRALLILEDNTRHSLSKVAEFASSLAVDGFQASNVNSPYFIQNYFSHLSPSQRYAAEMDVFGGRPDLHDKEIDVVFKDGRAWGEVKYYRDPIRTGSMNWKKIVRQAKLLIELQQLMNRGLMIRGKLVQLDVEELHFFAPNGIETKAARVLEQLGYQVHGPRIAS